jgi:hypothetical protein
MYQISAPKITFIKYILIFYPEYSEVIHDIGDSNTSL